MVRCVPHILTIKRRYHVLKLQKDAQEFGIFLRTSPLPVKFQVSEKRGRDLKKSYSYIYICLFDCKRE